MQGGFSISYLCYPHIVDVFTNSVGEQRNFCFAEMRRPAYRRFVHNLICDIPNTARLNKFVIKPNFEIFRNGLSRAPAPTIVCHILPPQNRCRSLRTLPSIRKRKKAVQSFHSDTALVCSFILIFFYCLSAPLSRLSPIEALPQTPTGLCPVPTMGFTP